MSHDSTLKSVYRITLMKMNWINHLCSHNFLEVIDSYFKQHLIISFFKAMWERSIDFLHVAVLKLSYSHISFVLLIWFMEFLQIYLFSTINVLKVNFTIKKQKL